MLGLGTFVIHQYVPCSCSNHHQPPKGVRSTVRNFSLENGRDGAASVLIQALPAAGRIPLIAPVFQLRLHLLAVRQQLFKVEDG